MEEPTIDMIMKAYAADAVACASKRNITFDYSEESLAEIDRLLGSEEFIGVTPRKPYSSEDEETLWTLSKMIGAYVGEVTIRVFGGSWQSEDSSDGSVCPIIEIEGIKGYPIEKVWKRLTESQFDGLGGYCRTLRAIVSNRIN